MKSISTTTEPDVFIHYAMFFSAKHKSFTTEALLEQCDLNEVTQIESFDSPVKGPSVFISKNSLEELAVPSMQLLQYFGRGFNQSQAEKIMSSAFSVSLVAMGPFDKQHSLFKTISKCAASMSNTYDSFVFDVADSLTFTPEAFQQIRLNELNQNLMSAKQFGVRAYRVEEGVRSVSMGLEKFGQYNLVIENFSEHHMGYIDKFFNLVLQQVIESDHKITEGKLTIDVSTITNKHVRNNINEFIDTNGTGKTTITLEIAKPLDGDPQKLLAIRFKSKLGEPLWTEQSELLKSVFGKDRAVSNVTQSISLEAAIIEARNKARTILENGHTLEADGIRMLIATELTDAPEVVWVEVKAFNGTSGIGVLLSQPKSNDRLKSGSEYEFTFESIMDFKLYGPEGLIDQGGIDEIARSQ
ncbi:hypothetical protein [Marinicellulosiphila megalodicopiae]|uniref:hypothetical protein n=1 Tax=Marinicellulosiphila megalodicopiae TaxID=2724896 RepID=UPI003BB1C915